MESPVEAFDFYDSAPRLCIVPSPSAPLSPAQQAFNTLIAQIETQQQKLAAWDTARTHFRQKYQSELLPIIAQQLDLKVQIIYRLDAAFDQKGLNKNERSHLVDLILHLVASVQGEREDEALFALADKYQAQVELAHAACAPDDEALLPTQAWLEQMAGLDQGEYCDMSDPEAVMRMIEARMAEEDAVAEAHRQARQAAQAARQAKRMKTAKQIEKEARLQAEEKQMSQSIRELYRKLASLLHPDREPDPIKRLRKTDLMQRANQAYENNNLFKLLELHMQLALIDQSALGQLSSDRLQQFMLSLKAELKNVTLQVKQAAFDFHLEYGINPAERLTPKTAVRFLSQEVRDLRQQVLILEHDLIHLRDIKGVKSWLRVMQSI